MNYFHKFLIVSVISLHLVTAGTTGKLVGIVLDRVSKEPLIGANVMIAGTGLGTSTDAEGRYFILQVPPKTYISCGRRCVAAGGVDVPDRVR